MARKQPPPGFDPHPGDPWHPDWSEAESSSPGQDDEGEDSWWRRALRRADGTAEPSTVPTAYSELEVKPSAEEVPPVLAADAEGDAPPAAAPVPAPRPRPMSLDHRLFGGEETAPAVAPAPIRQPQPVGPTDDVESVHNWAADLNRQVERADDGAADVLTTDHELRVVVDLTVEPEAEAEVPQPSPEELSRRYEEEAAAGAAAARSTESDLVASARLEEAEARAHEEARMWTALAGVHAVEETTRDALQQRRGSNDERAVAVAAIADEARTIDAARERFDESRKRTEQEVRAALDTPLEGSGESPASPDDDISGDSDDFAKRFSAIAAQLEASADAELDRSERREQIRLRTSLLMLDAEQPWDNEGWSRPGYTLGTKSTNAASAPRHLSPWTESIGSASAESMPQSKPRRRWALPRRRKTSPPPTVPRDSLRSVIVLEETAVSGRQDDEVQDSLPFDDVEEGLAAWSDLDWDLADSVDSVPDVEVDAATEAAAAGDEALDDEDAAAPDGWDTFTAGEYVQAATHEYAGLAAAVAASAAEAPEHAAITADMPGIESSLVNFDDVVAAEGMERADAAPHRSDLAVRVLTAAGLIALFFASLTYRWSIGLLVLIVMMLAAGELTTVLVRSGYHPIGLFTYMGTAGALLGTWVYGPVAVPVAIAATLMVVVLYFGLVTGRPEPLVSMALTVTVVLWVGALGAFAYDLVPAAEFRWLVASFVVIVATMDVAQYFVGKRFGKRRLAPVVSPKKTVAGLVGGVIVAVLVGYGLSFVAPFDEVTGIVLGAALAATGPFGDLAVSVLKRSLDVKDMGTILPGHGGVLDRIDAILFSLPAAWAVYAWAGLLV